MLMSYVHSATSVVLRFKILDSAVSTGAGKAGITSASAGLIISTIVDNAATATAYTQAGATIEAVTTLGTYLAPTATKCRIKEVDATNHPGVYELQLSDARFAIAGAKSILISISGAAGAAEVDLLVPLTQINPYDTTLWTSLQTSLAEVAGIPAANATLIDKVNWIFALSRNKGSQTATTKTLHDDAGTGVIATSTVSDDGTTFNRGEYV